MKFKKKHLNFLIEQKIILDRGNAWFYWLRNFIIMVAGIIYILNSLEVASKTLVTIIAILGILIIYFAGYIDIRIMKLYQLEQKLVTSKFNPHLNKLSKIKIQKV